MEEENKIVNVHSSAIHIENKVSLKSRLAWFYMLYKAYPVLNIQSSFNITIGELKKAIGYTSKNNKGLKTSLEELARAEIQWNIFNKDGHEWGISHLLSECRIKTDSNVIYYEYSSFVKEKLSNPEMYVKINLLVSKNFKSKHSLSLYCLALDYLYIKNNYGEKNISIEDIRKYLGLEEDEYNTSGELYKHILKRAEKEINNNSDLNLTIDAIKGERNKILGFKLKMSIKEQFLDIYKPQKTIPKQEEKQITLFEKIEIPQKDISKKDLIKIEGKELKEFFAEYKISIATNTVQSKFKEVKEMFNDRFEDYLIFLMSYTKSELKLNNIKNVSGFYVGLLKDDNQLENYIIYFQNKKKEEEKRRTRIKSLVEVELKKQYDDYVSKDFNSWIIKNIEFIETKVIDILTKTTSKGNFLYDFVIPRHNNGIIDKTIITNSKEFTQISVINHLNNYKEELDYKPLLFDDWKNENIKEEDIKKLEEQLLNK